MQIILAGCERVGAYLAHKLYDMGHDLVIIEDQSSYLAQVDDIDCVKIQAKVVDIEAQRKAGAETADVFIAASSNENVNVMAAEVAQSIFNVPRVIVRTLHPKNDAIFQDMGLETFCSTSVQADQIIERITEDHVYRDLEAFGHTLYLKKETLIEDFYGKTVLELEMLIKQKVIAILRDNKLLSANFTLVLQADDEIICFREGVEA